MLNMKITDTAKVSMKRSGINTDDIDPDDMNTISYMIAGQIKAAAQGNTKAMEYLSQLSDRAEKKEDVQRYTVPITDITSDFVEVYRKVHAAFSGEENIREVISKGGRGSIKSNFWAAVAEETIYNDPHAHVVYTRRYKVDLRGSVYNQFMKTVIRHEKLDEWEFTTNPMRATYKKTGQCVLFVGADKPISLKSYNLSFGYVKLLLHEECDEMAGVEQMDNIEDTFLRSDTPALDVKIFNPPKSKNNFMNEYVEECRKKAGTYICHSYYYNVPLKWLGKRFFERAEWFKEHKPRYYKNNYLGEVTGTGGAIFENIEAEQLQMKKFTICRILIMGWILVMNIHRCLNSPTTTKKKTFFIVCMKCFQNGVKILLLPGRSKSLKMQKLSQILQGRILYLKCVTGGLM